MELFESRRTKFLRTFFLLFPALLLVLSCTLFVASVSSTSDQAVQKEQNALEQALKNGAIRTYALTGTYPESLSQLLSDYHITYFPWLPADCVKQTDSDSSLEPQQLILPNSGSTTAAMRFSVPWMIFRLFVSGTISKEKNISRIFT